MITGKRSNFKREMKDIAIYVHLVDGYVTNHGVKINSSSFIKR